MKQSNFNLRLKLKDKLARGYMKVNQNHKVFHLYETKSEMLIRNLLKSKHINSAANSIPGEERREEGAKH